MNMSFEKEVNYKEEIEKQIQSTKNEINQLQSDYESAPDDIVKSQIKTFLEKKQLLLLNLMERYYGKKKKKSGKNQKCTRIIRR